MGGLELANVILEKPLKMLGKFSLDYGTFWGKRPLCELAGGRHAGLASSLAKALMRCHTTIADDDWLSGVACG